MTSYKKAFEESEATVSALCDANAVLKKDLAAARARIKTLEEGLIANAEDVLTSEDAKALLRTFSSRTKNRSELLLLIRVLTKL